MPINKAITDYQKAVTYLENLPTRKKVDYEQVKTKRVYFLKRFIYLMNLLGNPQNDLKYFHVGGTSGKGSVSSMLQSVFSTAGYKTGLFVSPHCITTAERISIDGKLISPADFARLLKKVQPYVNQAIKNSPYGRPSYSEILNAIAFLYFKENNCDLVVLEVGMGGKYDSTNIIKNSRASVINNIGLDHVQVLGNTIAKIAKEKSGIIKPHGNIFIPQTQHPDAIKIIKQTCTKKNAKLHIISQPKKNFKLKLIGEHQQQNAAIVATIAKQFGINEKKINQGLSKTSVPCRFEIIQQKPTIILDGAHNIDKIKSTAKVLTNLTYKKLYLIIALTSKRNAEEIFNLLFNLASEIIVTHIDSKSKKFYSAKSLATQLPKDKTIHIISNPSKALAYAKNKAQQKDAILITGSFYLAGELRKKWYSEKDILINQTTSWQKI
jgi:dihydrofolate synthase/folylpolyglutamate synthase